MLEVHSAADKWELSATSTLLLQPADWIMIVAQSVSEKELESQGFFENDPRPVIEPSTDHNAVPTEEGKHVGFGAQLTLLFQRDLLALKRDKRILGGRLMITSFISILMGIIFWQVGNSDSANYAVSARTTRENNLRAMAAQR